jgi:hypothetical protein
MDKDRQIRFLYPPLFFIGFWLWALYLDPNRSAQTYLSSPVGTEKSLDVGQIAGIIASGSVAVLVAGFLISVVSVVVLRMAFATCGHSTYEVVWTDKCRAKVSQAVGLELVPKRELLYLGATFDQVLLPDNVHTWILRRWSSFNISCHSCTALILAVGAVSWSGFSPGRGWYVVLLFSLFVLSAQSRFAWRETMGMVEFYSQLDRSMLKYPNSERPPVPVQTK